MYHVIWILGKLFQIYGSIEASDNISDYGKDRGHWLIFDHVQNLLVQGGGTINGNGKIWWQNSCKINKSLVYIYLLTNYFSTKLTKLMFPGILALNFVMKC